VSDRALDYPHKQVAVGWENGKIARFFKRDVVGRSTLCPGQAEWQVHMACINWSISGADGIPLERGVGVTRGRPSKQDDAHT